MIKPSYALAIHGGAGTITPGSSTEPEYHEALRYALQAGEHVLIKGGEAIDAVQASVMALEDCPLFNAGRGSVLTAEGTHEMDACIMDGRTLAAGAVAGVKSVRNPVVLARTVMTQSEHVLLIAEGAERFARACGVACEATDYFVTPERLEQLSTVKKVNAGVILDHDAALTTLSFNPSPTPPIAEETKMGTVGAVALDKQGNLAAATSTGGLTNKRPGRVGDSAIVGAGCYANNKTAAISTTGMGEYFIRCVLAHDVSALMDYAGLNLEEAARRSIHQTLCNLGGKGGLIAVDSTGRIALPYNTTGMYRAWVHEGQKAQTAIGEAVHH